MSLLSGMSAELAGSGDLAGALQALSNMTAEIGGSGDLAGALGLLVALEAVLTGAGSLDDSNLTGFGNMSASILSYGELTPEGLRDAVWSKVIEAGFTAEQIIRIIAAQAAGAATGLEGANPQFTGLDGTTLRIDGTYSAGTRTIDSLDGE